MTTAEQLAFIKSKCIEANPSIKDLVFGCVVKQTEHGWKQRIISNLDFNSHGRYLTDGTGAGTNIIKLPSKEWEIIGRPITLPDVLLAIGKKSSNNCYWSVSDNGQFVSIDNYGTNVIEIYWNLLLPLDGQKEEVWAFLVELLHD